MSVRSARMSTTSSVRLTSSVTAGKRARNSGSRGTTQCVPNGMEALILSRPRGEEEPETPASASAMSARMRLACS